MDGFDLKIIVCLMNRARTSWAELGNMLGLSAPAAAERVHKLEEKGTIKGYAALVDPEALGYDKAAFISVTLDRPEHRQTFLQTMSEMPQILECHHVAGDDDYILKVRSKGTRGIEQLISEKIKAIPGVIKTRTTIILSTVKETPVLPLIAEKE
jgi:Lrp/AsnC family leucine-responsive transcriptional regulator